MYVDDYERNTYRDDTSYPLSESWMTPGNTHLERQPEKTNGSVFIYSQCHFKIYSTYLLHILLLLPPSRTSTGHGQRPFVRQVSNIPLPLHVRPVSPLVLLPILSVHNLSSLLSQLFRPNFLHLPLHVFVLSHLQNIGISDYPAPGLAKFTPYVSLRKIYTPFCLKFFHVATVYSYDL